MFFFNQKSVVHSVGLQKKGNTVAYGKRKVIDGNVEMVEGVAFSAMQEASLVEKRGAMEDPAKIVECHEKTLNIVSNGNRIEKDRYFEGTDEAAFSTRPLLGEKTKRELEEMTKCSTGDLRMKLWDILGTAPSQNKHTMNSPEIAGYNESLNANQGGEDVKGKIAKTRLNSPEFEENKEKLNVNQNKGHQKEKPARMKLNLGELKENRKNLSIKRSWGNQKGETARAKQNSDIIEIGSERTNQIGQRPVTCSFTRTEDQSNRMQKLQGNTTSHGEIPLSSWSFDIEFKHEKGSIFTFDEEERKEANLFFNSGGHPIRSKKKIKEHMAAQVIPRRIYFPISISEKSLQNSDKEQTLLSSDKQSSQNKKRGHSSLPHHDRNQLLQKLNGTPNDSHYSQRNSKLNIGSSLPAYNKENCEDTDGPLFKKKNHSGEHENSLPDPKYIFLHANVSCQSMGRESDKLDDFQSPSLAMNLSLNSSSMPENQVSCSPVVARASSPLLKSYGSKDLDDSTSEIYQSDTDIESSDATRDTPMQGDMDSQHENLEHTEKHLSLSPVEEWYTESVTDDLISQGHRLPSEGLINKWIPTVESHEESPCSLHHTKRVRNLNNVKHRKANLFSSSPYGNLRFEEIIGSLEALERKPESTLSSCVAQLTVLLESFRARMESQTSKMCSYILSAAAYKIRRQLYNVEIQIMADLGKFNNIGKLKRKLIETTFQEQQDRLKLIHEKFKEEVRQHLTDCRATLEELGALHMGFKRNLDRQKVSHRKLLLEVKEAMEVQIKDAEASIAVIHKDSRKKMVSLKHVLKDWMN